VIRLKGSKTQIPFQVVEIKSFTKLIRMLILQDNNCFQIFGTVLFPEQRRYNMEVEKILWPTDFSGSAQKALSYVKSLSEKYQTEVHVLYVIQDLSHPDDSWYGEFDRSHIEKIHEWERKTAEKRLNEVCENYLEKCPLYIKHIAIGDPAAEILKLVDKEKIDIIVMSSRGAKNTFRFGSVAEKIVKNSSVPVVTIPID
jgi:nucleotide-binding universal stress UspA family protein